MTRRMLIVFAIVSLTAIAHPNTAGAEAPERYDGPDLRRWSAVVSDLDETIRLYTEILGFELGDVSVDSKTSYVYEIFNISTDITTRHATFHAGDKKRVLSVVEVPGIDLPKLPQSPRMSVALINANGRFDEIYARLAREGYEVLPTHALGDKGIEVGFIDRDGHLYALYEYPYEGDIEIQSFNEAQQLPADLQQGGRLK